MPWILVIGHVHYVSTCWGSLSIAAGLFVINPLDNCGAVFSLCSNSCKWQRIIPSSVPGTTKTICSSEPPGIHLSRPFRCFFSLLVKWDKCRLLCEFPSRNEEERPYTCRKLVNLGQPRRAPHAYSVPQPGELTASFSKLDLRVSELSSCHFKETTLAGFQSYIFGFQILFLLKGLDRSNK